MTEAEIITGLVNGAVIVVAVGLFVRILCDEYLRELGRQGLLRSRVPSDPPAAESRPSSRPSSEGRRRGARSRFP